MKKMFSGLLAAVTMIGLLAALPLTASADEGDKALASAIAQKQSDDAKKMYRVGNFPSFEMVKPGAVASSVYWIPAKDFSANKMTASSAKLPATCRVDASGKPERGLICIATSFIQATGVVMDSILEPADKIAIAAGNTQGSGDGIGAVNSPGSGH